jgi:putative glutamine amidotransferase
MKRRFFLLYAIGLLAAGLLGYQIGNQPHSTSPGPSPIADEPRPLIGIASLDSETYIRAVRESGGIPVVLPNTDPSPEAIEDYLTRLDALLLPGGADIPPSEYGEEPHPTVKILSNERFSFEKAMGKAWIERTDKPLLGICLGSQWINVLHGGSLVQDIPSEFNVNHRDTTHPVTLEPDSRLGRIFGETEFEVNSLHHQAVRKVGPGLRIVACSPEGIVEATESVDPNRFLIGVQWHPEKLMPADQRQAKLLKAFVEAAKESRRVP